MPTYRRTQQPKARRGVMTVELAITTPLLMLMMVGAADFARVFYHAIEVANASATGAFWGSGSTLKSATSGTIQTVAEDDAADLQNLRVKSEIFCDCPGNNQGLKGRIDCINEDCGLYGSPRVYSRVVVQQQFEPMIPWPGIPNPVSVSRESYFRVQ